MYVYFNSKFTKYKEGSPLACMYVCMYVCMYAGEHQWLLGEEVDLLPALLLPLAGPEQFSEEETERLPLDLQYLPDDKRRESDPDIRKMLIETIMQVGTACGCSTVATLFY